MFDSPGRKGLWIGLLSLIVIVVGFWTLSGKATVYEKLDESIPDPFEKPRVVPAHTRTRTTDQPTGTSNSADDNL